jgi:hypothetical protein
MVILVRGLFPILEFSGLRYMTLPALWAGRCAMSAAHATVSAAVANTWISMEILEHSRVGLTVRPGKAHSGGEL